VDDVRPFPLEKAPKPEEGEGVGGGPDGPREMGTTHDGKPRAPEILEEIVLPGLDVSCDDDGLHAGRGMTIKRLDLPGGAAEVEAGDDADEIER
jgi:hypothetical protein